MYWYDEGGRRYSREELQAEVEAEVAGLPAEQWLNGRFEFDEWLSDSIVTGTVKKVSADDD